MDLKRRVLFSNSLGAVSLLRKVHVFLAITNVYKFSLSVINSVELLSIIFVFTVVLFVYKTIYFLHHFHCLSLHLLVAFACDIEKFYSW